MIYRSSEEEQALKSRVDKKGERRGRVSCCRHRQRTGCSGHCFSRALTPPSDSDSLRSYADRFDTCVNVPWRKQVIQGSSYYVRLPLSYLLWKMSRCRHRQRARDSPSTERRYSCFDPEPNRTQPSRAPYHGGGSSSSNSRHI